MIDILIMLLVFVVLFAIISYVIGIVWPLDPALRQLILLIVAVVFLIWVVTALAGYAPALHTWKGRP